MVGVAVASAGVVVMLAAVISADVKLSVGEEAVVGEAGLHPVTTWMNTTVNISTIKCDAYMISSLC